MNSTAQPRREALFQHSDGPLYHGGALLYALLAYGLVGATALLILLLHLLRPRALRRAVASTVLWEVVLRQRSKYHTPWRWLLSLLLCLSVLFTHQHHLVDIAGGFVLAWGLHYLFRLRSAGQRSQDHGSTQ